MTTLTEGRHPGEFILSEANGNRSRDNGILASGNNLEAGTVVSLYQGKWGQYTNEGNYATAHGILYASVDATSADQPCVVVVRDAEVIADCLTYESGLSTAETDLAAIGIIVREA